MVTARGTKKTVTMYSSRNAQIAYHLLKWFLARKQMWPIVDFKTHIKIKCNDDKIISFKGTINM